MKEVIQNIIQGLVLKQLGEDDALISSGLIDSVIIIELILEIEQKLELIVDLSEVTEQNFDSINKLHQFLLRKSQL
ncbi:phosphopantetheine-binding protein [Candidatus Thiodubiliella endoseptemdiera]